MKKQYINFLKFISTILVICIHLISKAWNQSTLGSFEFNALTIIDAFCLVSVPLFLMCSGAIFLNRNDSIKKIIFKYTLKIYLIAVIFGFIYRIIDFIIYKHGIINISSILNMTKESILLVDIYHLWYLKVIIFMYITIPIFKYIQSKNIKNMDHILLVIIFLISLVLPMYINNSVYMSFISIYGYLIYFYLGYYLDKYNNKKIAILLLILYIASYIYTVNRTINTSVNTNSHVIDYLKYQTINIMLMSSFIFSFFQLLNSKFKNEKINKFLSQIARPNFYVYLIHGLVIGFLSYINIINIYKYDNLLLLIVYVIIVYVICIIPSYVLYIIINKIKKVINS